jgi:hypothetical protein
MSGLSRREFAGSVLAAALVPVLGPAAPTAAWWESAAAAAGVPAGGAGDLDALARALAAVVRAQYGDRLSAADLESVTRQIRQALDRAEQMRKIELANGDEPDFVFSSPAGPP